MNTNAATLEQFGTLSQIAQMYIRDHALSLGSCSHYDFVVCPQRAITLLNDLQSNLTFIGNNAENKVVQAILLNAARETQVVMHIALQEYLIVQLLDYNLLYSKLTQPQAIHPRVVNRRHPRAFYG